MVRDITISLTKEIYLVYLCVCMQYALKLTMYKYITWSVSNELTLAIWSLSVAM
uniref:Uncharacterized protein n=1 Tax=Rhizophora mucronata TaxID=61149 RepID=A0A2P2LF22_RHIMU